MDRRSPLDRYAQNEGLTTLNASIIIVSFAIIYLVHLLIVYLRSPLLSPWEIAWNILVYICPARLLLDHAKRKEMEGANSFSQVHAAKSEALRVRFGFGDIRLAQNQSKAAENAHGPTLLSSRKPFVSNVPPGLGNWDNSCYQNSVLQGLSAMKSLRSWLGQVDYGFGEANPTTTGESLRNILDELNDHKNNGKHLWTPPKLKSMSSWQQQDAQEYFSKIMDDLEKEAARRLPWIEVAGLKDAVSRDIEKAKEVAEPKRAAVPKNPIEGLLAQRVACTRCGFSEGLSMIPFNCLTLPLGSGVEYDIEQCLDEYTRLEDINDVDCAKCTLQRVQTQLRQLSASAEEKDHDATTQGHSLPSEVRDKITVRLDAVNAALEQDDYADKTLSDNCQISRKAHVSSTKTRQAVVGRGPESLVLHVNRSVFDEMTGAQRKNSARVLFPTTLDLSPWMFSSHADDSSAEDTPSVIVEASRSMLSQARRHPPVLYRLQAFVAHYGRHENGHYIAFRRHETSASSDSDSGTKDGSGKMTEEKWWRMSDEDVSAITEADALNEGGVFMLLYERLNSSDETTSHDTEPQMIRRSRPASTVCTPNDSNTPMDRSPTPSANGYESETTTECEEDVWSRAYEPPRAIPKPSTPPLMRTAGFHGSDRDVGFAGTIRPMATT